MKKAPTKKDTATKATTTKKNTTAEAARNRAVDRIAGQLGITTEEAAAKLLDLAILHVDDNLMMEDEPFLFTGCIDPYSATEALAKMTDEEIIALEGENNEGKFAQRILYEIDCTARGVQPEGANMPDNEERLAAISKKWDIPAEIKIPTAVYRLAKQLDRDPGELARDIMQAGVEALDDGLANQPKEIFSPVSFVAQIVGYSHFSEFTITGWIDRMTPEARADCEKEAEDCDQTLQEIVRERCRRGVNLKELAQPELGDWNSFDLGTQSNHTGIAAEELRAHCLRAGIELLQKGELKITDLTSTREVNHES